MPLYDYKCSQCENLYETREGFDAPSRQPCPRCGGEAKRVLHPPPIVFKGSGFYITDSRKGSQATLADNGKSEPASTTSASAGDGNGATPSSSSATPATTSSDD